jgi:outer membrane protein
MPSLLRFAGWFVALPCLLFAALPARAAQKPLWEFGLGVGAIGFSDYRGAETSHLYPVPVPYFVYRGKIFKADREGVRGLLFNQEFAQLSLSVNATTPVRSRHNRARRGMPDLKPTVEVGPSLDLHLWRSPGQHMKLDLRLPLREALTIESSPQAIGWQFTPQLAWDVADAFGHPGLNLGVLVGPVFADSRYVEYFYSVAPGFSTAQRPDYRADSGFAGSEATVALSRRYPRFWVGTFVRLGTLSGASFASSPLVRRDTYWSAGVGIAWMISRSSRLVEAQD